VTGGSAPTGGHVTGSQTALEVSELEAGYGRTVILRGVTLRVPLSGAVALLGPNGAGKTTLLRAISGFITPTRGSVHLFGEDVTKAEPHRRFRKGLCHVPEGRGVFRSLTVRENIIMQSTKRAEAEAIDRAVTAFPILGRRLGQRAGTMSGGEQQMLAMAAAYVRNPRLILVDEASLGLAPLAVDEIFGFLGRVTSDKGALLIIDQFATRVLPMVVTAYVMQQGRIVFGGSAEALSEGDLFAKYIGG
jgi:branched-chain amino acid transport system ATP-binding protein